jgi:hypothetical protein
MRRCLSSTAGRTLNNVGKIPSRGIFRIIPVVRPDWRFLTTERSIKSEGKRSGVGVTEGNGEVFCYRKYVLLL